MWYIKNTSDNRYFQKECGWCLTVTENKAEATPYSNKADAEKRAAELITKKYAVTVVKE